MDKDAATRIPQAVKVMASGGALVLLIIQVSFPSIPVNTTSLILLFLFIVPWWIDSIDSLELPGVAKIRAKPALSSPTEEEVKNKLDQEVVDSLASSEDVASRDETSNATPEARETTARERYKILEANVLNFLPSLGFDAVKTEIVVDEQNGKRYIADAIALSPSNVSIVEITMPKKLVEDTYNGYMTRLREDYGIDSGEKAQAAPAAVSDQGAAMAPGMPAMPAAGAAPVSPMGGTPSAAPTA